MSKKSVAILSIAVTALALMVYSVRDDVKPSLSRLLAGESNWFVTQPLPLDRIEQIFDMGVVDANQDGFLDIYTSNHNYRQYLWLADGKGGYTDKLEAWGLSQVSDFPGWEQSMQAPVMDKPGLYVYWQGDSLHLVSRDAGKPARVRLHIFSTVEVTGNDGFAIEQSDTKPLNDVVKETWITLLAPANGHIKMFLPTRGGPLSVALDKGADLSRVYLGNEKVTPAGGQFELAADQPHRASWTDYIAFSLTLLDRHAMVWADYNNDGQLDLFANRGAMGGSLRNFPDYVRASVKDELLVSRGGQPHFTDITHQAGIEKRDCSGRHAKWVDFNQDGRLDLFINCLDRGNVGGVYGKQLYAQGPDGHLSNVAAQVGLALSQYELNDLAWLDMDNDGDLDLVTHESTGVYAYRQQDGRFNREFIARGKFERGDIAALKGDTFDYWQFDGKMSFGDVDNDGDLDLFISSKKGNLLLISNHGKYELADLAALGLPTTSVSAVWADYDNDGHLDLSTVPEGLYHQTANGRFERTHFLATRPQAYQAAILNWFDRDNDGKLDALIALEDNFTLWRWWQKPFLAGDVKGKDDRFGWRISGYRNVGAKGNWLQLRLVGAAGNPQAIGARVTLTTPQGHPTQTVGASEGSYLSQGHYRLYYGLGGLDRVSAIQVHWPDGRISELHDIPANQLLTIHAPE